MDENSEVGTISVEQMAEQMAAKRESPDQPEVEELADEQTEIEAETDEEVTDEAEALEDDQAEEADAEDEVEEVTDAELFYELDGEDIPASQLKEWKQNGMLQADYTRKRQEDAEVRKATDAELAETQQLKAQLQDALATFAIDNDPQPDWLQLANTLPPEEFQREKAAWDRQQAEKGQAAQAYQAMLAQQRQEVLNREQAAILEHFPQWSDPTEFQKVAPKLAKAAETYGFSADEFAAIQDHRMYRVLDRLAAAEEQLAKVNDTAKAIQKRVVKAKPKLPGGSKPAKNQAKSDALQKSLDRFNKTGSVEDQAAYLKLKRSM